VLTFLEKVDYGLGDLSFIKLFISVSIKWSQTVVHSLSDLNGEIIIGELEFGIAELFFRNNWLYDWFVLVQETVESRVNIIIRRDPKLVTEIFQDCQESLDPV
jgi:hypothetical protein